MGIFAIASFVNNGKSIGAKVYSTESQKISNLRNDQILDFMKKGYKFENLGIKDGCVHWTNGVFSRYPMIYADGTIENRDAAVVIAFNSSNVKLLNIDGKRIVVPMDKAIRYANSFGIANCKVIENKFIQSINGEIPKLEDVKLTIRFRPGILEVTIPEDGSVDTLDIKSHYYNMSVSDITNIFVTNKDGIQFIKRLHIPSEMNLLYPDSITQFVNLEELVIDANFLNITPEYVAGLRRLRVLKLGDHSTISGPVFKDHPNINRIYGSRLYVQGAGTFANAIKLDVNHLITQCRYIKGESIFSGINVPEIVIDNDSLDINLMTFIGMKKPFTINFKSDITRLVKCENFEEWAQELSGCTLIMLGRGLVAERFAEMAGIGVMSGEFNCCGIKVKIIDMIDEDDQGKIRAILKNRVLDSENTSHNLDDIKRLVFKSKEKILPIVKSMDAKAIKDLAAASFRTALYGNSYRACRSFTFKYRGYTIEGVLLLGTGRAKTLKSVKEVDECYLLQFPGHVVILPFNREAFINVVENTTGIQKNGCYINSKMFGIPTVMTRSSHSIKNIDVVMGDNNVYKVIIKFKNGNIEEIEYK